MNLAACAKVDVPSSSTPNNASARPPGGRADAPAAADASPVIDAAVTPPPKACVNLQCQQMTCPSGATTTVSGTVFAPNGTPMRSATCHEPNGS